VVLDSTSCVWTFQSLPQGHAEVEIGGRIAGKIPIYLEPVAASLSKYRAPVKSSRPAKMFESPDRRRARTSESMARTRRQVSHTAAQAYLAL